MVYCINWQDIFFTWYRGVRAMHVWAWPSAQPWYMGGWSLFAALICCTTTVVSGYAPSTRRWWPQLHHVPPTAGGGSHFCLAPATSSAAVPSPLKALPLPVSTSASMALVLARQFCQLQSSRAVSHPQGTLPPSVLGQGISTPLRAEAWE